jgi:phage gp16-like protein
MSAALARQTARFPADPHRRAMIAKIHVAKKELDLVDDDYRAILMRAAGQMSAADCSIDGLRDVLKELGRLGFQTKPRAGAAPRAPRPADHPAARKARALWISLHQLGAIDNPSEQALEAFAARQLGVAKMQWVNQALMYKLVEALKAIAERNGWSQDTAGIGPAGRVKVLKLRLCEAILAKLVGKGLADADWPLERAAWSLLGLNHLQGPLFWEIGYLDLVAQGFARKLRSER